MNSSIIQKLYLTPKFVSEQKKFWEHIYAKSAGKI